MCTASPSVEQIRNLGMLLLLSEYQQGPTQGLEVGDMGLCTQARHTVMLRNFAAFMGSTVLSLGLSAIGPTALQTSDLSTTFERNLHLDVGLVSDLGKLFVFSRIPEYL